MRSVSGVLALLLVLTSSAADAGKGGARRGKPAAAARRAAIAAPARPASATVAKPLLTATRGRRAPDALYPDQPRFGSFFGAGFESATGYNKRREKLDLIHTTQHDRQVRQDYRRLRKVGIKHVRESIRWPLVDLGGGRYDFSTVDAFVAAGKDFEITQIWDMFHYGFPADVDPFSDEFVTRFEAYATAVARYLKPRLRPGQIPYFTPINEISYFSYAAGEKGLFAPYATGRGGELKRNLVKAAIAGINAIRRELPAARMVNADPLVHVHAPAGRPDRAEDARVFTEVYARETFDMLSGKAAPELGGSPAHLDIIGLNYYSWTNQWELDGPPVGEKDPRHVPLHDLVESMYRAYAGNEIMITETAHIGNRRGPWVLKLMNSARILRERGVPLLGVTLYPIIGMHEWHDQDVWVPFGLWDTRPTDRTYPGGEVIRKRVLHTDMNAALQHAIRAVDPDNATRESRRIRPRGEREPLGTADAPLAAAAQ